MRVFNAFQVVVLFIAMPWIIGWLKTASFTCSEAVFYVACAVYVIGFVMMVACVSEAMEKHNG